MRFLNWKNSLVFTYLLVSEGMKVFFFFFFFQNLSLKFIPYIHLKKRNYVSDMFGCLYYLKKIHLKIQDGGQIDMQIR